MVIAGRYRSVMRALCRRYQRRPNTGLYRLITGDTQVGTGNVFFAVCGWLSVKVKQAMEVRRDAGTPGGDTADVQVGKVEG